MVQTQVGFKLKVYWNILSFCWISHSHLHTKTTTARDWQACSNDSLLLPTKKPDCLILPLFTQFNKRSTLLSAESRMPKGCGATAVFRQFSAAGQRVWTSSRTHSVEVLLCGGTSSLYWVHPPHLVHTANKNITIYTSPYVQQWECWFTL